ncbi:MAG: hypothetical protein ACLSAH_22155 [Bilophila wadsworthia]
MRSAGASSSIRRARSPGAWASRWCFGHNPDQIFLMGGIHNAEQDVLIEFLMETLSEETGKALARWRESCRERSCCSRSIHVEDGTAVRSSISLTARSHDATCANASSGCRSVLQDVLRVPPRKLWAYMAYLNNTSYVDFEFCNQIRNGTFADTVRQFYEQAEIDYESLRSSLPDMAGPMKAL